MKELKDILTEEELELATKMAKEFAEKVLLDFSNQKEALATEIQKLKDEDEVLKVEYSSIAEWKQREVIMNKRGAISALVNIKTNQLKNIDNQLKAISNGGTVVEFEDKTGKVYKGVPDFRNVNTDKIIFDPETILVDPAPAYIPLIDEEKFRIRGTILDAIRYTNDTYVVSYSDYQYSTFENQSQVFLVTLDQLVLISLYYLTKLKAVNKKKADQKTEKSKEYYFSLPLERREKHYAQRGFYRSINKTLQKKYSEEEWDILPLSEKEKLVPAYKVYGAEKIKTALREDRMYSSFHDMYNVFINPEFLRTASNKTTRLKIGEKSVGAHAHPLVFKYWRDFREMMEYKFKDIEFQREEMSENYKTAIETSFGESNTENYLYADYGVLVKRQNGDKINASETEQIEQGLIEISKVFGNLKDEFIQNNMKISHTGKKLVFAQKAVGVYIPSMGTIAVSDKYGEIQFNSTFAHELAHFIDNKLGQKNGKRWETDNFESTAGVIAFTFRNNLNKPKEQQTDYINATKECFARAMQQYFVMQKYGDDVEIVYGYGNFSVPEKIANQEVFVNKENFNSKIKPLIEQFLQENKDFFSAELQMKKVVEEIKETTAEIVPAIENKPQIGQIVDFGEGLEKITRIVKVRDGREFIEAKKVDGSDDRLNLYPLSDWSEILSNQDKYKALTEAREFDQQQRKLREEAKAKEELEKQKEYDNIDGFYDDKSALQRSKVLKYLNSNFGKSKIKNEIREAIFENNGYINTDKNGNKTIRYNKNETTYILSDKLQTKTAIDYAEYLINVRDSKQVEPIDFDISKINLKGVTTIFTEDNGKTLIYGTKTNQTRISVLKMSQEEIKEEIDFEKKIYEKTKKDISEFNESEIKNSYALSTKEKLDIIKLHNQSILKNEERKKIIIPFLESHLEQNEQVEPSELQEAIETLKMLLETLPDDEKQEVEEALEILEMLN
jgi:hypothetical protein